MHKVFAVISAVLMTGGIGLTTNAEASSAQGAAALQGLQSRSIQISTNAARVPLLNPYEKSTIGTSGTTDDQTTYRQLNDDTNLVVSPVKGDRELLDNANAGDTGNNRIQVLYQPVQ